jgi:ankyrin repeat protein
MAHNQRMNTNQNAQDEFLQLVNDALDRIPWMRDDQKLQEEVYEILDEIEETLTSGRVTADVLMTTPLTQNDTAVAMNRIFSSMNQHIGGRRHSEREMMRRLFELILQSYPGDKINVPDTVDGQTLLHMALFYDCPNDVIQDILASGADINVPNREGKTLLHLAASRLDPDRVRFLIEKGADPDLRDRTGGSPLHELNQEYSRIQQEYGGPHGPRIHPDTLQDIDAIRELLERHMTTRNNNMEGGRRRSKNRKGKTRRGRRHAKSRKAKTHRRRR